MTDRIQALTVVLDRDIRTDDVEHVVNAIQMVRGVAHVTDQHIADMDDHMARQRVRHDLAKTIHDVFIALMDGRKITIEPRKER